MSVADLEPSGFLASDLRGGPFDTFDQARLSGLVTPGANEEILQGADGKWYIVLSPLVSGHPWWKNPMGHTIRAPTPPPTTPTGPTGPGPTASTSGFRDQDVLAGPFDTQDLALTARTDKKLFGGTPAKGSDGKWYLVLLGSPSDPGPPKREEGGFMGLFGLLQDFTSGAEKDPAKLRETIFDAIIALSTVAAALSLIPTEANFGGPLAARLLGDLVDPFRRRAYDGQIDVALRPLYPQGDVSPRLLVSGIEEGAITDAELHGELVRSGVREEAQMIIARVAAVKRFNVETKDDLALAREFQKEVNTATIRTLQDQELDAIRDLKERRREVLATLRKMRTKVAP